MQEEAERTDITHGIWRKNSDGFLAGINVASMFLGKSKKFLSAEM